MALFVSRLAATGRASFSSTPSAALSSAAAAGRYVPGVSSDIGSLIREQWKARFRVIPPRPVDSSDRHAPLEMCSRERYVLLPPELLPDESSSSMPIDVSDLPRRELDLMLATESPSESHVTAFWTLLQARDKQLPILVSGGPVAGDLTQQYQWFKALKLRVSGGPEGGLTLPPDFSLDAEYTPFDALDALLGIMEGGNDSENQAVAAAVRESSELPDALRSSCPMVSFASSLVRAAPVVDAATVSRS